MLPNIIVLEKRVYHCSPEHAIIIGDEWALSTNDDCEGRFYESIFDEIPEQQAQNFVINMLDGRPDAQVYQRTEHGWVKAIALPAQVKDWLEDFATQPNKF